MALGDVCGPEDIISRVSLKDEKERKKHFRGAQNYRLGLQRYDSNDWKRLLTKGKIKRFKSHWTASQMKEVFDQSLWESYFKFCFERNPWDKMVSHYYWKIDHYPFTNFEEYWEMGMNGEITGFKETLSAKHQYMIDGELVVDQIYKFEELSQALADLTKRLGLSTPLEMPKYKAKGAHRPDKVHYRDLLTSVQADRIAEACSWEIETLNYSFD